MPFWRMRECLFVNALAKHLTWLLKLSRSSFLTELIWVEATSSTSAWYCPTRNFSIARKIFSKYYSSHGISISIQHRLKFQLFRLPCRRLLLFSPFLRKYLFSVQQQHNNAATQQHVVFVSSLWFLFCTILFLWCIGMYRHCFFIKIL